MGAQFLHGTKNVLYDVAEQNKLIKLITPNKKKLVDPVIDHGCGGEFLMDAEMEVSTEIRNLSVTGGRRERVDHLSTQTAVKYQYSSDGFFGKKNCFYDFLAGF